MVQAQVGPPRKAAVLSGCFLLYNIQKASVKYDSTTAQEPTKKVEGPLNHRLSTTQVSQLIILMGEYYMSLRDVMALFNLNSVKRFR